MKDQVSTELKQQFRPEFLNRLDDIIVFRQLTEPQVRQIVDLDVNKLNDRLFDRHMSLELTDAAKDLLAQKGFDPLLGARPLRRVIQRDIEDAISEKILLGELEDGPGAWSWMRRVKASSASSRSAASVSRNPNSSVPRPLPRTPRKRSSPRNDAGRRRAHDIGDGGGPGVMDSAMATGPPHTISERSYGWWPSTGEPTRDMKKVRPP